MEDTDRARLVPGAAEQLEQMLRWAGLHPDESPAAGGPHAPYTQSRRLGIYQDAAEDLLERGAAYRCFCTVEQLTDARSATSTTSNHMYDGTCRRVPPGVSDVRARTEPHTIRLAVPREPATSTESGSHQIDYYNAWWRSSASSCDGEEPFGNSDDQRFQLASTGCVVQDAIRGQIRFEYKEVDDAVLIKSDGFPSYHLASVVDDHAM